MTRLTRLCGMVLMLVASISHAEFTSAPFATDSGTYVMIEQDASTYIVKMELSTGTLMGFWTADANYMDRSSIAGVVDDDLLLRYYGTYYRYSLPEAEGSSPVREWAQQFREPVTKIEDGLAYAVTQRGITIHALGDDRVSPPDIDLEGERFLGFGGEGYYTTGSSDTTLVYYDLTGHEQWSTDIGRIGFNQHYIVDGFIFLANSSRMELYSIDESGHKLWRQDYPSAYGPDFPHMHSGSTNVVFAGDYVVFVSSRSVTIIELANGELVSKSLPGVSGVPFCVHEDKLIKIGARIGLGDSRRPVEIYDVSDRRIDAIAITPDGLASGQGQGLIVDGQTSIAYLFLQKNRVVGVDLEIGEIVSDVIVEIPTGSGW